MVKVKISQEFAEDLGIIPVPDLWNRSKCFGFEIVSACGEEEYLRRMNKINKQIGLDENGMVEVDIEAIHNAQKEKIGE